MSKRVDTDELLQMFQSITTSDHDELVDQFAFLLETDANTATFFLESSNWNVEIAVNNYLSTVGQSSSMLLGFDGNDAEKEAMEDCGKESIATLDLQAKFVSDLSEAQNIAFSPGVMITMQWSFVNTGTQSWPSDTYLVFDQGIRFDGPEQIQVAAAPGQQIDLTVHLYLPEQHGTHAGSWQLRTARGSFGDPVWIVLTVGIPKEAAQSEQKMNFQSSEIACGDSEHFSHGFVSQSTGRNEDDAMDL